MIIAELKVLILTMTPAECHIFSSRQHHSLVTNMAKLLL